MSSVKLIGITKPVGLDFVKDATAENLIAYCARVSNPANQENPNAERLLNYCIKNSHWSIFEMVHIVMEVNTTRDIARQILRHRSFSFQEFSQRYAEVQEMSEPRETRLQDNKNRQNSVETDDQDLQKAWRMKQHQIIHETNLAYKWAIQNGIAKEVARSVLPEGLTMSRMYMAGSLRSWIHYCDLRMNNGTQKEHREIATDCWNIIKREFPSLYNVLDSNA
jgi:thymidylate synthase (FAD)